MLLLFKAFITSILFNLEPSSNLAPGFIRLSSAATGTVVAEIGKEGAKPYLGLNFPASGIQIHARHNILKIHLLNCYPPF